MFRSTQSGTTRSERAFCASESLTRLNAATIDPATGSVPRIPTIPHIRKSPRETDATKTSLRPTIGSITSHIRRSDARPERPFTAPRATTLSDSAGVPGQLLSAKLIVCAVGLSLALGAAGALRAQDAHTGVIGGIKLWSCRS
jgi:hypothetical protein